MVENIKKENIVLKLNHNTIFRKKYKILWNMFVLALYSSRNHYALLVKNIYNKQIAYNQKYTNLKSIAIKVISMR